MRRLLPPFNNRIVRHSLKEISNSHLNISTLLCMLIYCLYLNNFENIQNFISTFYTPKVYVVPCGETIALSLECECENCNIINIGTISFIDIDTGSFASVGHSISHSHSPFSFSQKSKIYLPVQLLITQDDNNFNTIIARINSNCIYGTTYRNSNLGIYGQISKEYMSKYSFAPPLEIASRYSIKCGSATLLSDIYGKVEEFEIEILQINIFQTNSYECMLIQITDERLLNNSGGIVRGMSGCPIIQNNKIIGVLSSMLIKDTTKGYALFADLMIKELY